MKHWVRVRQALLLSLVLLTAWILPLFRWDGAVLSAAAVSTDYPVQHFPCKRLAVTCLHRGGLTVWERTQTAPFSSW